VPLRILFADDSMTAQNMGKKILTEAGYEVVAVSNGAAAVKKIAEHKPDIIILDVYMPGYSGLEVCEKVRASIETMKTPVLLTVGKMEPYKPEDANRVKADGVIIKPFEASDLLAIVKKLEERIVPSAVPPLVQQTIRLERPPDFSEFAVHSTGNSAPVAVAAVAAPAHEDLDENTIQPTVDVPDHMATVSAFSDLLGTDTLSPVEFSAPAAPEPPVEIAPAAISPDPSATFTSIPEIETVSQFAPERPAEIASTAVSSDPSATFTSIPEIETVSPSVIEAVEAVEAKPPQQEWGAPGGLHSDFVVTPEPASVLETTQQLETPIFSEPVASESIEIEPSKVESVDVAAPSAEVPEVLTSEPSPQSSSVINPEGVYPDTQPIPVYEEPEPPAAHIQLDGVRIEPTAATLTDKMPAQRDPAFEPTQAESVAATSSGIEPGLEPTIQPQPEVSLAADPNLVTERAALESFPTTFGVQNPEEIPVGIASDLPAFATSQAGEKAIAETENVESRDVVAPPEEPSAPASADDDFEARVAAAMNVYAEPAEARVEQGQESDSGSGSNKAHAGPAATPEDDFDARVAAAMSLYEEPQATAAFADEMQPPPVYETSEIAEATVPAKMEPAEPQLESLPAFHAQAEIPPAQIEPIQAESIATIAEAPVSFEYSPPVTEARVYPEPKIAHELQIESSATVQAVQEQIAHFHHDNSVETTQNESAASSYGRPIVEESVPEAGFISAPKAVATEIPQASTEQIAASIEAEMPVEAVAAAAVATGADSDAIAQVVHRVMERIKPELIAAIVRELNSQK